jgi:hypothetical protein
MLKKISCLLLFAAILFTHWSCKKELDPTKYSDPYPISIKVESSVEGNEITWSPVKTSDFVSYRIWRVTGAADTIPNKPTTGTGTTLTAITTITDSEKISFSDAIGTSFATTTQTFYYRVEAVLKNRSILSRNFRLENTNNEINDNIGNVKFDKSRNEVYLLNSQGSNLHVFNTQSGTFIKIIPLPVSFQNAYFLATGKANGKNEVYVAAGKTIYVVDAEQGKTVETISLNFSFGVSITNVSTDNNGKLFISTSSTDLFVLDRNNKNAIEVSSYAIVTSSPYPFRFYDIPGENALLGVESNGLFRITTFKTNSSKTQLESMEKETTTLIPLNSSADVAKNFVLDANTFIISGRGYIYDRTLSSPFGRMLNSSNSANTTFHLFKDFQALDKNRYVSISATNTSSFTINSWRSPNTVIKEKFINSANAIGLVVFDENIWVVVSNFNTGRTSVKKYKYL